jgi:hypothetical protein
MQQRIALVLAVDGGELRQRVRVAEQFRADRGGDVERIEIGQCIDRRMRDAGADRLRQAEGGGVDGTEGQTEDELVGALGDSRLMREQRAEILEGDLGGDEREGERPRCHARKPAPPPSPPM